MLDERHPLCRDANRERLNLRCPYRAYPAEQTAEWMVDYYKGLVEKYPLVSIEDPLAEDDEAGLIAFTEAAGRRVQIVGDDYLVTNATRVEDAARRGACNAVLLKPNQAGTITGTKAALRRAAISPSSKDS